MKTTMIIQVRAFPVTIQDMRKPISPFNDTIVVTKQELQAAQLVGESSKELITRICNRRGYEVLSIRKPEKDEITINLERLWLEWDKNELKE